LSGKRGDRDADRKRLAAVAADLLATEGPAAVTTRRVAQAAGVAHGLLYTRFEDKDDLLLAALVARASALVVEFDALVPEPGQGTVADNLLALSQALVSLQAQLAPLLGGLLGNAPLLERFARELHAPPVGGPNRILSTVHEYLGAEQALGRVDRDADVHVVGVLLFALAQLQALVSAVKGGADAAPGQLEPFAAFFVRSLEPR
jgi:AcrR family transcriptional regulator